MSLVHTQQQQRNSARIGMNISTANSRLRKMIMWDLILETDRNWCFRCGKKIKDISDLSIDHKQPWRAADDPKTSFFDLNNIAFSHFSCNTGANGGGGNARKTHCPQGHPLAGDNLRVSTRGYRICRACERAYRQRKYRTKRLSLMAKRKTRAAQNRVVETP